MGFFSNDSEEADVSDERVEKLVQNAQSDTVNSDILTKTDTTGIVSEGIDLSDEPLIRYLENNEQPNFIWFVGDPVDLVDECLLVCVTDHRIIVIKYGHNNEDYSVKIPFDTIHEFDVYADRMVLNLRIGNYNIVKRLYSWFDVNYRADKDIHNVTLDISENFNENRMSKLEQYLDTKIEFGNALLYEEFNVQTYHVNEEATKNLPNSQLNVIFGESSIEFGNHYDDYAEIDYDDIVDIQGNQVSSPFDSKEIKLITKRGIHVRFIKLHTKKDEAIDIADNILEILNEKTEKITQKKLSSEYILVRPYVRDLQSKLKVEGWTDGSSEIRANVDAESESRGKSKEIELGMFSYSKNSSRSSIEGYISGEITDNTYTSNVKAFKIYDDSLVVDSGIKIDLHYSEINNIHEQEEGVVIEAASTTFRVKNVSHPDIISEAVNFVKDKLSEFDKKSSGQDEKTDNSTKSADKLKELNQLHEDGILTDEEFESKKKDILDDF